MKNSLALLLNLICGCLFCVVCLDFDVIHCVSSESIDYRTLVEATKNSLQSTDSLGFIKKAEEILGRPLASDELVKLLECRNESASLFSKFSNLPSWQKLILAAGCWIVGCAFFDHFFIGVPSGEDLSATSGSSLSSTTESERLVDIGESRHVVSRFLKRFDIF